MKKIGILIICMAIMSTAGLAQNDTTYYDEKHDAEKSQDYGKDKNYNEDQSSEEDQTYDRSYDENPAREEQTWQKDTTEQYGSENRSYEIDSTEQHQQDRSYDSNEGMNENKSYGKDTTDQGMYGNRSYESDTSDQRTEGERSWQNDTSAFAGELSEGAKQFIKTAAESSKLEMYLAQIALQKEEVSDEIVRYGQNLVEDHAEANRELKDIVNNFQVEVPALTNIETDISNEHQDLINDLRDMEGDEFHESFINRMVEEHQSLIDEFEKAKGNIDNQELSRWIDNTLPALKDHLNTAQALQSQSKDDTQQEEDEGLFEEDK